MPRLAILILLLAPVLPAQAQPEALARVTTLIEQLAHEEWRTRETASRELAEIGEPARAALQEALRSDDAEVRVRASDVLIRIGETFGYAVQCATSEDEHLVEHGRAALQSLFRIDDPKVLRALTAQEIQARGYGGNSSQIVKEPALALAQLTAASGMGIFVSEAAREQWQHVMEQPNLGLQLIGGGQQIQYVLQSLNRAMQQAQGVANNERKLVARAMRLGRAIFLYITVTGGDPDPARTCGRELVEALLGEGADSVKAAGLLAEGAAGESAASERIREEYRANPGITRLMWLALGLGTEESVTALVREANATPALAMLAQSDWSALDMAARFLLSLEPGARGTLLGPRIETTNSAMEATISLWLARGCPLSAPARKRALEFVASKQDSLAAASVRWFAGSEQLAPEELDGVWNAVGVQPLNSSFYSSMIELISREDIAERLVTQAREALRGTLQTQQALAAAVLKGRTLPEDLATVMEKLSGATGNNLLANELAGLMSGVEVLPEQARNKLVDSLCDSNPQVRQMYLRVLRRLAPPLRREVCNSVGAELEKLAEVAKDGKSLDVTAKEYKEAAAWIMQAWIAVQGIRAGAGEMQALEQIGRHVQGQNAELAKSAGTAVVDALQGEPLYQMLEDWKSGAGIIHGTTAAVEAYAEICRRAVDENDRAAFRKAFAAVNTMNVQAAWQVRYELQQMQGAFAASKSNEDERRLPPRIDLTRDNLQEG